MIVNDEFLFITFLNLTDSQTLYPKRMKLATAFLLYTTTAVQSAPVYYSDRASFDAATGGGLSFESFEQDFASSASVAFTDFAVSENNDGSGFDILYQLRGKPFVLGTATLGSVSNAFTDGTGALAYIDNGNSVTTFFSFSTPITAFGLDVTTDEASSIAVGGGSISIVFNTAANTPQFLGVIDTNGIAQVTFNDSEQRALVAFDSLSYGVVVSLSY